MSSPSCRCAAAHAVLAGLGLEVLLVAVVDQGVQAVDRLDPARRRPGRRRRRRGRRTRCTSRAGSDAAAAAVAGADLDAGVVEELHVRPPRETCPCRTRAKRVNSLI